MLYYIHSTVIRGYEEVQRGSEGKLRRGVRRQARRFPKAALLLLITILLLSFALLLPPCPLLLDFLIHF
jgi:hypothetical protein